MKPAPTQRRLANIIVGGMAHKLTSTGIEALDAIVGQAQNRPPEGESDGSIDAGLWYKLRDLHAAAIEFDTALKATIDALNKHTQR